VRYTKPGWQGFHPSRPCYSREGGNGNQDKKTGSLLLLLLCVRPVHELMGCLAFAQCALCCYCCCACAHCMSSWAARRSPSALSAAAVAVRSPSACAHGLPTQCALVLSHLCCMAACSPLLSYECMQAPVHASTCACKHTCYMSSSCMHVPCGACITVVHGMGRVSSWSWAQHAFVPCNLCPTACNDTCSLCASADCLHTSTLFLSGFPCFIPLTFQSSGLA
jgi:hypothetical protein